MAKTKVGVVFGGKSAEHEISLLSAKNVIEAIDKDKFEVVLMGIDKKGIWHLGHDSKFLLESNNPKKAKLDWTNSTITLTPESGEIIGIENRESKSKIDVIFPVLHGPLGEDGTIQGFFRLANLPYVGSGVLGSSVGMDKDVMKRILRDAGVKQSNFITYHLHEKDSLNYSEISKKLGSLLFVKPANMGSSVGISKAKDETSFKLAIDEAFKYDRKIIVEEFIKGREIECAVLGNENPRASIAGEIIPNSEFYSYEAKYVDENGAVLEIPAKISDKTLKKIQEVSIDAYKALGLEGMSRVDFFLTDNEEVYLNEVNTIPGFTKISMYPKLWEASGLSYTDLISELINLAIDRHKKETALKTTVE